VLESTVNQTAEISDKDSDRRLANSWHCEVHRRTQTSLD